MNREQRERVVGSGQGRREIERKGGKGWIEGISGVWIVAERG